MGQGKNPAPERQDFILKKLSYKTLDELNYDGYLLRAAPERVLQFGEGNFLRAFAEDFIDRLNQRAGFASKVVLVQPRGGGQKTKAALSGQEGLYTLLLRGKENGREKSEKRIISCVSRCLNPYSEYDAFLACAENPRLRFLISNTTEAGIAYDPACRFEDRPAQSFPGKLTQLLYRRFQVFGKEKGKGFILLPCELTPDNGKALEKCVTAYARQWRLGEDFQKWLREENIFCSTLVDRIVTGYPEKEAAGLCRQQGYEDEAMVAAETFASWVIEGPPGLEKELPFAQAGLPVRITDDLGPYRERKVRILNGAHTAMVLGAYLAGRNIVRECMQDEVIRGFMNRAVHEEIIPTLSLPEQELMDFAEAVTDRFDNPFIDHALLSIALNSASKWRTRVLPSLKGYIGRFHRLPACLTASLAFFIAFYRGARLEDEGLVGLRGREEYLIRDDRSVLEFFCEHREDSPNELAQAVLSHTDFWGEDLTGYQGLCDRVAGDLETVERKGAYELMGRCVSVTAF